MTYSEKIICQFDTLVSCFVEEETTMYGHKNMLFCFKMVKILGTEEIRPSALNSFLNFFFFAFLPLKSMAKELKCT